MKNSIFTAVCIALIVLSIGYVLYNKFATGREKIVMDSYNPLITSEQSSMDSLVNALPVSSLEFDRQIIDFGDVRQDTLLTATYIARNTGQNDIVIAYVNPECICTSYRVSKTRVSPSDTLSIVLTLDTTGKRYGQILHTTVRANTNEKMHRLLLKANITDE